MSGIDDLNFEDLVDGAINTIDEADTERFEAKRLLQPKLRTGSKPSILAQKSSHGPGADVVGDPTIEMLDDTARMEDPSGPPEIPGKGGRASFDHIYMRAGVQPHDFTVFRLEELYHDDDLTDLDQKGRVAAVRAILKSHDVEFEVIVEDAVARRAALDAHDQRLKSNIQRVEREMEKENAKLQAEIEEYANPRIERMEKNNERVERLRRDYAEWFERKQDEQTRIVDILEPWGGDDRLRATEKVEAVSGDEAFEPQSHGEVEAPQPVDDSVLQAAGADQWEFDSDATAEPEDFESSVATSLPSEYEAAEQPGMTGEFDFAAPSVRIPRTVVQWLATLLIAVVAIVAGLLLAAQLSMIEAPGALLIGLTAAGVLAIVPTFFTRMRSDFWSGWVPWWLVCSIVAFAVAHYDPANLVRNLTKRPIWFVDEAGLNEQVEQALHQVAQPYAEAIAPVFGVQDAIWTPAAEAAVPAAGDAAGE